MVEASGRPIRSRMNWPVKPLPNSAPRMVLQEHARTIFLQGEEVEMKKTKNEDWTPHNPEAMVEDTGRRLATSASDAKRLRQHQPRAKEPHWPMNQITTVSTGTANWPVSRTHERAIRLMVVEAMAGKPKVSHQKPFQTESAVKGKDRRVRIGLPKTSSMIGQILTLRIKKNRVCPICDSESVPVAWRKKMDANR